MVQVSNFASINNVLLNISCCQFIQVATSFLSIGTKLVFLVLAISLVSIAVTTALAFNLTDSILKTNVEQTLADESEERGSAVSSIINQRTKDIESLAANDVIQNFLLNTAGLDDITFNQFLNEENDTIAQQVRSFRLNEFSGGLKDLKIVNRLGTPIFSLNEEFAERVSPSELGIAKTDLKFIQDKNKERLLKISVPILGESKSTLGTIIATTPTTVFDSILLNRFGLQETGEVYLVNKDKKMISDSIFVNDAPFRQIVKSEPVTECFENGLSISGMTYQDYRGVDIFGVSYCEKDLGFVLITEVDEDIVLEPIYELQQKIMIIGGSIMAAASVATFVFSKRISNPIQKLRNATNEVSKGNFNVQTNIQTNDEIGELSSSFDSMTKTIQETISAITRRENIIKQQENILMRYSEQKQECCVCLVDIVGSIIIKDKLSEEQAKLYYDTFIESVSNIVKKYNGILVKAIDDSLLFYFPTNTEQPYQNAIECCLEISDANTKINEKLKSQDLPEVAYRISSTFGEVNITKSSTNTLQDIFGEPVNLCFKINQYALPNTLVVDDLLYQKIKDDDKFKFTRLDQSLIKGLEYLIFIVIRN